MDSDKKIDDEAARAPPRKMRFGPKPIKREQNLVVPKVEKVEEFDAAQAEQLMLRLKEASSSTFKPKVEREVKPAQVAFGFGAGAAQSSSIRSYGTPKPESSFPVGDEVQKMEKEYKERWDHNSEYPVTLPCRPPHSGNPDILDKEEFGEDFQNSSTDEEKGINPAIELGLQDMSLENDLFFIQLPKVLPQTTIKPNSTTNTKDGDHKKQQQQDSSLEGLEAGLMGKMLIYKSGAIKLKIGEILYDVSPGVKCGFSQKAFAINDERGECTNLGEINRRAVAGGSVHRKFFLDFPGNDIKFKEIRAAATLVVV